MLDSNILAQLKEVFSKLEKPVTLKMSRSTHPDQTDLEQMLQGLTTTSEKIQIEQSDTTTITPQFDLLREGKPVGITFRGVPGGHEFSSLILSILYADGKGKLPDSGILNRIKRLKGPIQLKTYVSLSCENCPEVVQALNLMSTLHEHFQNETIDGGIAQDEVQSLGIQGVPAVFANGKLIHSGKIQLLDLLVKLETLLGTHTHDASLETVDLDLGLFDVAVIGGGPAGASAAIYSARKGLRTAMIAEKLGGQLRETKGIENMISVPYTEGTQLAAQLADHVSQYSVQTFEHRRVKTISGADTKQILLESGESLTAKAVIIATGAKWRELGIPGEKEHIGQGVAFCAHCDGPFYKDKKVAVVGGGNSGVEAAIDLAGIAREVILLEYSDQIKADPVLVEKLKLLPNASIITQAKSTQILGDGKRVVGLRYEDRSKNESHTLDLDGVFVQIGLLPNSQFVSSLVNLTPYGEIVVDPKGRTSVPGIYAAGDVTTIPFKQIVTAMGDGAKVALTAFEDRIRGATH